MPTGTVKWFNPRKGYGFIIPDDESYEKEIFVHYSVIKIDGEGFKSLNPDDKVEFEVEETGKGLEARNVVVTEKAPSRGKRFKKRIEPAEKAEEPEEEFKEEDEEEEEEE
jgi:CspA family cold shock protein